MCRTENVRLLGHRDDKTLDLTEKREYEGKFRALRFRIDAGDTDLKSHLESAWKNALLIGKPVQNDLILRLDLLKPEANLHSKNLSGNITSKSNLIKYTKSNSD